MTAGPGRRGYLDWLRGVAVLIMIEAHTLDSWTRVEDRGREAYSWSIILGGMGAPIFLFLAGIALALAGGARLRRGGTRREAAARLRTRGWQIFGLAFLFRLQSWVISRGPVESMLKVDILNVMGLTMVAAGLLWGWGRTPWVRAVLLASAAVAATLLTPIIRVTELLAALPDPVEWYLRPVPGRTTFTLFPWGGFLLAGTAIGLWLEAARTDRQERRVNIALAFIGPAIAVAGYAASYLPPMYEQTNFWTSSPTFFFLRLGILIAALPLAYVWNRRRGWSPVREFGLSSLFVYWIHVEMVYGVVSAPLHRRLPFEGAVIACLLFAAFLFGLVKLKEAFVARRQPGTSSWQSQPDPASGR